MIARSSAVSLPGFDKNRRKNLVDLADVMKECRDRQAFDLLCRQRKRLPHHARVLRNAPRMT